jgi:hypothetical protein
MYPIVVQKVTRSRKNKKSASTSQTLKEIYKLCKTDEDLEEDEDSESLDRANDLIQCLRNKLITQKICFLKCHHFILNMIQLIFVRNSLMMSLSN